MEVLALAAGYVTVIFLGLLGVTLLVLIWIDRIDLRELLAEDDGGASFSRFQFLVFTFVIAMCLLLLTLDGGKFPPLGGDVLALLGISGGSYVVSKGVQTAGDKNKDQSKHVRKTEVVDVEKRS
jgi:uncharacterized membrane protein YdjX (TVP38/TMEM64 family)